MSDIIVERQAGGGTLYAVLVDAGVVAFTAPYAALPIDTKLAYERAFAELPEKCEGHDAHDEECPYDESLVCGESCAERAAEIDTLTAELDETRGMLDELLGLS